MKPIFKAAIALFLVIALANAIYFIFFYAKENDPKMMEKTELTKTAFPAHTVSVGGEIIYTVSVTNRNSKRIRVFIEDALPENATLVGGEVEVIDNVLCASLSIGRGKTKSISYKVRIGDAYTEGAQVLAPAASILDKKSSTVAHLVGRTLDASERSRMRDGILALTYSEKIDPMKLLKDMYLVAFSASPFTAATPEEVPHALFAQEADDAASALISLVVPSLYRAPEALADAKTRFRGESILPKRTDLVIGDVLLKTKENKTVVYIFNGEELVSLMNGAEIADTDTVLSSLDSADNYAVLRPSLTLSTLRFAMAAENKPLTEAQRALIATAKAYLARGYRAQYDDSRMYGGPGAGDRARGEFRWQIGHYQPEEYSSQQWGYLNCAAFTYEAYRTALGLDIGDLFTTYNLASYYVNGGEVGAPMYPFVFFPSSPMSEGRKQATKTKFLNTLEVGDLVVIRRNNGNGHVMLYIGDGVLIHSSGASFNYNEDRETYEPTIRYMNLLGYLFDPTATNYVFSESGFISSLCIVRPLDRFKAENRQIPENTVNRMENMENIFAEKLSSHPKGKTVTAGDRITYTFRIENRGFSEKKLQIRDAVPFGAELSSKGDFSYRGAYLVAKVRIPAGEQISLSYTVTVREGAAVIIDAFATVGGVKHFCAPIYVGNTLTAEQQSALVAAAAKLRSDNPQGLVDLALASAIYREAGLSSPFAEGANVRHSLFRSAEEGANASWTMDEESPYYKMLVPTLYGGRRFFTPQQYTATEKYNTDRSRLPREQALVVGDLIVVRYSSSERIYLYTGADALINLSDPTAPADTLETTVRLMRMMSVGNYYAVLRPSLG